MYLDYLSAVVNKFDFTYEVNIIFIMLPSADRLVGAQLNRYIRDMLYWVLHTPRQTGKTTFLQNRMREINAVGDTNNFVWQK